MAVNGDADPAQVYEPIALALPALHEKILVLFEALKVAAPSIVSVTVTVAPLGDVVKPTAEHPLPVIAVLKLPARVEGVPLFT